MQILPRAIVRVRRRRWRVAEVHAFDGCDLVTLRGIAPPDLGVERRVLSPFDRVEPIERRARPKRVGVRLWRAVCRAALGGDTPPGALRSAVRAGIDLLPYQLEPALAIVRGLGCRLLLADEVGLGKTIQAGLVVAELRARGAIGRALVLTPAGIRDQWRAELADRFGLAATIVDARAVRDAAGALPFDVNPWSTFDLAIASLDYVKRTEVLPAAAACPWDLVIVDEAHGAASDSDRRAAAHALCAEASYVLLLTATPHSGDGAAFASLCRLGQLEADDAPLLFRRTRSAVGQARARRVRTLSIRQTGDERRMHAMLQAYADAVLAERTDAMLAISVLQKRAISSAWALAESVDRRLAALAPADEAIDASQLALPFDPDGELTPDDAPPEWPEALRLDDRRRERRLLEALAATARAAATHESKVRTLVRWLRRTREPALVFTEYRDTLRHLESKVAGSIHRRVLVLHGGMTRDERHRALRTFAAENSAVLLATDAAGEGLNLQEACRLVVNLELPWNPMRLEQRIGRVDRIGQRRRVHALHLVADGTYETTLLDRLTSRVAAARAAVGAPDPTGTLPDDPAAAVPPRVDLTGAGREEAGRTAEARRLMAAVDARYTAMLDRPGPLVVRARSRLKARLGGRRLEIWRLAAEDGCGRVAESRLVALLVDRAGSAPAEVIAETGAAWRALTADLVTAFAGVRVARDRIIATRRSTVDRYQPELFDRQRDREHDAALAARHAWQEDIERRLDADRLAGTLTFADPELLLVATP